MLKLIVMISAGIISLVLPQSAMAEEIICDNQRYLYVPAPASVDQAVDIKMVVFRKTSATPDELELIPYELTWESVVKQLDEKQGTAYLLYPNMRIHKVFDSNGNFFFMVQMYAFGMANVSRRVIYYDGIGANRPNISHYEKFDFRIVNLDIKDGVAHIPKHPRLNEADHVRNPYLLHPRFILLTEGHQRVYKHHLTRVFNLTDWATEKHTEDFARAFLNSFGTWELAGCD